MYNEFVTPEMLATFAGLVVVVSVIVQFTKGFFKQKVSPNIIRLYTFIISVVFTSVFAKTGKGIEGIMLIITNAILVSIAAMGGYEVIKHPKKEKK